MDPSASGNGKPVIKLKIETKLLPQPDGAGHSAYLFTILAANPEDEVFSQTASALLCSKP